MNILFNILTLFFLLSCNKHDDNLPNPEQNKSQITVKSDKTYNVNVTKNIVYAQGLSHSNFNSADHTTLDLKMDIYTPENHAKKRPAMILIHGGAFSMGNKSDKDIVNLANFFASRGWVAFSINYRLLSDKGTVPDKWIEYAQNRHFSENETENLLKLYPAHRDAKAALRWIVANADKYNIDTNHITVGGGSAGAMIANAIGVTEPQDYTNEISITEDPTLASTNLNQNYTVQTILDFWGSPASINMLDNIYGQQRFDKNDAPILIAHGTDDRAMPFNQAESLRDEYKKNGVDYEFHPLQGFGHRAWIATVNGKTLGELSFDFIVKEQNLNVE